MVPAKLSDKIYQEVQRLSAKGNHLADRASFELAVGAFNEALELLPNPRTQWEAATWLYAAIGDVRFQEGAFALGREALFDALNCPGALTNPFIHLRLGQCLFELGDRERAQEHLLRAYMLDGERVFQGEQEKYLALALL